MPVEAFGRGGFRFGGMSHRGSILCLPSGVWGWKPAKASAIDLSSLTPVFAEADAIDFFLFGVEASFALTDALAAHFRALSISVEVTRTGAAVSTYNILLEEGRKVAAGLIAVD